MRSYERIEQQMKSGKYERIFIMDIGDIIESFSNAAHFNQLESNDLSPMQQVDVATSLSGVASAYVTLKLRAAGARISVMNAACTVSSGS